MKDMEIRMVTTEAEARRIVEFFKSVESFDDKVFMKGELEQLENNPYKSLRKEGYYYWYVENEAGEIIAAHGILENEIKSGGYLGDYLVIHKAYRKSGLAVKLITSMLEYIKEMGARYFVIHTSNLDAYIPIRSLLTKLGFMQAGYIPDYYYEGSGLLIFYKSLKAAKCNITC